MGSPLINLIIGLSLLPLLSPMLLDQRRLILIKVLENILVVQIDTLWLAILFIVLISYSINFIEITPGALFNVI